MKTVNKSKLTTLHFSAEAVTRRCSIRKKFWKFRKIHWKTTVSDLRPAILLRKETPTQVFSCEFNETFKSSFFIEHLRRLLPSFLYKIKRNINWFDICWRFHWQDIILKGLFWKTFWSFLINSCQISEKREIMFLSKREQPPSNTISWFFKVLQINTYIKQVC